MTVSFSRQPGCWERHLQRRYRNPLFPEDRRHVLPAEADAARARDRAEAQTFRDDFRALLHEAAHLPATVDQERLLALKDRIDRLTLLGMSLGIDIAAEQAGLHRLQEVVIAGLRAATAGDILAQAELDKEQAAHALHLSLLQYPVVAQLLRAESPIADDELVPTLLTEPEPALHAALQLFDAAQTTELLARAHALIDALGPDVQPPGLHARLHILEDHAHALAQAGPRTLQ
jgi:hypothetical protein